MKAKIDGKEYEIATGSSILTACKGVGINIPTLCYSKSIGVIASCRVCVVEVKGSKNLVTACNTTVQEGMEIITNSPRVLKARRTVLELILSDHNLNCLKCPRTSDCRLKRAAEDSACNARRFERNKEFSAQDKNNSYIRRYNDKCIMCGRCVRVCAVSQQVGVLAVNGRGFDSEIGCAWKKPLETVPCITCGQCVANCPTAALVEVDRLPLLKEKLADPDVHVVIATAPSVRVALGDGFGMEKGANVTGKMVTALKRIGFDRVFDLNLGADFTIMEESTEFYKRLQSMPGDGEMTNTRLPMLTSCCPGWVNYAEMFHPDLLKNVSSTKSPQQIFGALIKSYYAQAAGIDPKKIFTVMLMPCIAKQSEAERHGINSNKAYKDVDMTMTVRQLTRLIKELCIDFANLPDENFDNPLGLSSGAGLIFGTTGGVMEAALRTLAEKILGKRLDNIDFYDVRGEKGYKVAEIPELKDNRGQTIKVAVVSGISNAERLIQEIKSGEKFYHFVEIMACLGGCVNGGGMPVDDGIIQNNFGNGMQRAKTIYNMDQYNNYRRSHENPAIIEIYNTYLGEPNSELAHKLLHTTYKPRKKYNQGEK